MTKFEEMRRQQLEAERKQMNDPASEKGVNDAYRDLLGRDADPSGAETYKGMSYEEVANNIRKSDEFRARTGQIKDPKKLKDISYVKIRDEKEYRLAMGVKLYEGTDGGWHDTEAGDIVFSPNTVLKGDEYKDLGDGYYLDQGVDRGGALGIVGDATGTREFTDDVTEAIPGWAWTALDVGIGIFTPLATGQGAELTGGRRAQEKSDEFMEASLGINDFNEKFNMVVDTTVTSVAGIFAYETLGASLLLIPAREATKMGGRYGTGEELETAKTIKNTAINMGVAGVTGWAQGSGLGPITTGAVAGGATTTGARLRGESWDDAVVQGAIAGTMSGVAKANTPSQPLAPTASDKLVDLTGTGPVTPVDTSGAVVTAGGAPAGTVQQTGTVPQAGSGLPADIDLPSIPGDLANPNGNTGGLEIVGKSSDGTAEFSREMGSGKYLDANGQPDMNKLMNLSDAEFAKATRVIELQQAGAVANGSSGARQALIVGGLPLVGTLAASWMQYQSLQDQMDALNEGYDAAEASMSSGGGGGGGGSTSPNVQSFYSARKG